MEMIAGLHSLGLLTAAIAAGTILTLVITLLMIRMPDKWLKGRLYARLQINLGFLKFALSRRKSP